MDSIDSNSDQLAAVDEMEGSVDLNVEKPVFQTLYDLDEDERDAVLKDFTEKFQDSRDFMSRLYPRMKKNYKRYQSIAEPLVNAAGQKLKGRSNLYIPYPWAIVESEMPRMAGRLPRIRAFPRKTAERAKVNKIQDNLYYTFDRMNYIQKQIQWLRQYSIYGWSPLFYFWRSEVREGLLQRVGRQLKRVTKTVWDDFDCSVLDVWDSFMQPGVEDLTQGDFFIFRQWLSKNDIKARVEQGMFYDDVVEKMENGQTQVAASEEGKRDRDELAGFQKTLSKHAYGMHEVAYLLEDSKITVMIDRMVLARCGDNPNPLQTKPVINVNLMPMIGEPIGKSTIDQLAGLPEKLNAFTNARTENIAQLIQRVFLAKRYSNTDFNNMKATPGNIILTDDLGSIKELEKHDIGQSSEREILTTKEEMQFVSGVSDFIVGVRSAARLSDTATGVSTIVREANARFALKLATFESGSLKPLVEAAHAYNSVYMPEEKAIHVHGPEGWVLSTVTLDDIICECEFQIEPGSSAPLDQLSRREFLLQLLDRVKAMPQVVDMRKYMREVLEAGDIRNGEDLLYKRDEMLPMAEDMELLRGENIALLQGQTIELKGNDRLHLAGHLHLLDSVEFTRMPQANQAATMAHIQEHMRRYTAEQAAAIEAGRTTLFGGGGGAEQSAGGAAVPVGAAGGAGLPAAGGMQLPSVESPNGGAIPPSAGLG